MNRRDFLKTAVAAGIGFGLAGNPFFRSATLPGRAVFATDGGVLPDIVAVRNGEPEIMFDRGIAAMGGMGRFVGRGQTVAIKPNVSFSVRQEMGATTNPALVNRVIRHCLEAGAAKVYVVDHTIESFRTCYAESGIGDAAREAGAIVAQSDRDRYYVRRAGGGKVLREARIHETALEADVLINLPILKHHGGAGMTAGIKNLMGLVWDRGFYHRNDLQQCIADFLTFRKPDLTVIDAYRALGRNGPRSRNIGDVRLLKSQILSTDIVAGDAAAARLLGGAPERFRHIPLAAAMGFGELDPGKLANRRISL